MASSLSSPAAAPPWSDELAVLLATAIGTPLAGAILMYRNERTLRRGLGARHVLVAAAVTVAGVVARYLLLDGEGAAGVLAVQLAMASAYFRRYQGQSADQPPGQDAGTPSYYPALKTGALFLLLVRLPFAFVAWLVEEIGSMCFVC